MFAIISTGGKQYKVSQDTVLTVNKLEGKDGDKITINEVLFACNGDQFSVGSPQIDGAKVSAEILKQDRDRKILVFKKKRRKNYRRLNGHIQDITFLKVNSLDIPGFAAVKTTKKASAKEKIKGEDVAVKKKAVAKKKTTKKKGE